MSDVRYLLHGAAISLVWFVVVNALIGAGILIAAGRLSQRERFGSATFWLAVRLAPAIAAFTFVTVLFVPSYWRYEPRQVEDLDVTLVVVALATLGLFVAAALRGYRAWRHASRRSRAWRRASRPLDIDGAIPIYEVPIDTPIMALVGVFRPRLLVTRGVVSALTTDELRAGIAHELGHVRAWDNLKRLAMRSAPDFLWLARAAGVIEARWASAAEHAADRAAGQNGERRCALASALVKIARLTPMRTPIGEPISTLVDGGDIASRVNSLLDDAAPATPRQSLSRIALGLGIAVAFAAAYGPLLRLVHEGTEVLVNYLP